MVSTFDLRFLTVSIALHAVVLLVAYSPRVDVRNSHPIPVSILDAQEAEPRSAEPETQRNQKSGKPARAMKKPASTPPPPRSVEDRQPRKQDEPPVKPEPALEKTRSVLPPNKEIVPPDSVVAERPLPAVRDLLPPLSRPAQTATGTQVTLSRSNPLHVTYIDKISQMVYQNWQYPEQAGKHGILGRVEIEITIVPNGEVVGLRVVRTSGYSAVDEAALRAVQVTNPFPPIPPWIRASSLLVPFALEWIPPKNRE